MFLYTPFKEMEHNYECSTDFIEKKENLINFINNFEINKDLEIQSRINDGDYIRFFESNLDECTNSWSLIKIKEIFRSNKKRENYFDYEHLHIAIHIRRLNSHDNRDSGRSVSDDDYKNIIESLRKIYPAPQFHIFSQGNIDHFKITYNSEDVVLHINESIEDTFTAMVLADVLVTSISSFSYTAGLLSEGVIYYIPFWHPPLPHWNIVHIH